MKEGITSYSYDAWGNVTSIINQYGEDVTGQPRHQGNLNPIRYRGYHYDAEIGLYWLTTRFYDPQTGRFINADGQLNGGLLGNNLYAYCTNDPVNSCDCTGTCDHTAGMFDCGYCRYAQYYYTTYVERPYYLDQDSLKAPEKLLLPIDVRLPAYGEPVTYSFLEQRQYEVTLTSSEARNLQKRIVTAIENENTAISICFSVYGLMYDWFGSTLSNIMIGVHTKSAADVYVAYGTYTIRAALYAGDADQTRRFVLYRIDSDMDSSLNRVWGGRALDPDETIDCAATLRAWH
ncbi:MAG: RHS repeat-associated core domain-containing protein [Clostridia bacterium]|nr:RHS repeat-associated core domain-containing protein [Clostridia bacterium]